MPQTYDQLDVRFVYPDGWRVTEDDWTERPRSIALQSPGGAEWSVMVYDEAADPAPLVSKIVDSLRGEYQDIEPEAWSERFDDLDAAGYDVYFYYLDLLVRARAFAITRGERTYVFLWQAEDREFTELEGVFRAVALTLLNPDKYPVK